jgi:hypothetical protein
VLSLKSIFKRNGASSYSSGEIVNLIAQLEQERAAAVAEIEKLDAAKPALLVADDDQGLDALDRKRGAQERIVQKVLIALPTLQERLLLARSEERAKELGKRREAILTASDNLVAAMRATYSAFAEWVKLREQLSAAGFRLDEAHIPTAPGLLNLTDPTGDRWPVENFAMLLDQYRATASPTPLMPMKSETAPPYYGVAMPTSFGNVDTVPAEEWRRPRPAGSLQHPVALRQTPAAVRAKVPATAPAKAPESASFRVKRLRPPLPEAPPAGVRRCRVMREGYRDPNVGGPAGDLVVGDLVDIAERDAAQAVQRGVLEYAPPAGDGAGKEINP